MQHIAPLKIPEPLTKNGSFAHNPCKYWRHAKNAPLSSKTTIYSILMAGGVNMYNKNLFSCKKKQAMKLPKTRNPPHQPKPV
jgi:hypothetical protein